jgi:uncharacterized protein with HEPN domain
MRRDPRAFLIDAVEAADAILDAVNGITLDDYGDSRLIRSAVEREFMIIGEALTNLYRFDNDSFVRIEQAPRIIAFRNKLAHEYDKFDNAVVWGVIQGSLQPLRTACFELLGESDLGGG